MIHYLKVFYFDDLPGNRLTSSKSSQLAVLKERKSDSLEE
jgi:hypothetical protein